MKAGRTYALKMEPDYKVSLQGSDCQLTMVETAAVPCIGGLRYPDADFPDRWRHALPSAAPPSSVFP